MVVIKLTGRNEVLKYISSRLRGGWILVFGDIDCIDFLENMVYTPGSDKNEDFEVIITHTIRKIAPIFLALKTEDLREFLGVDEDTFNRMVALHYDGKYEVCEEDSKRICKTCIANIFSPKNPDEGIEVILEALNEVAVNA